MVITLVIICGYAPPPILRVGGGETLLLIYDVHLGRDFGRGQNMAARNLKPKGKKLYNFPKNFRKKNRKIKT